MKPVELVLIMRDKTRQALLDAGQNVDGLSNDYEELIRQIRASETAMQHGGQAARGMASDYGSLQSVLAKVGGTAALIGLGKQIIKVRSEFQNTEASFKVFLGSAEKATTFMKELKSYAFNNVFEFRDLTKNAAQLLAYQNSLEDIIPIIDKLSNIAAGANVPLENLVELYNKAKSQGKLLMLDIQQWQRAGVPVIQELAKQMNTTEAAIRDMVSAGKIGFEEINSVVTAMTSDGGMFSGMVEEKMKTLGDSIGLLQDSVTNMFNEIGEKTQDFLRGGILLSNTLVDNYEKVGKVILSLIATYGTYRTAVILTTIVEKGWTISQLAHYNVLLIVEKAQKALNATMMANPYVLVATLIVGLVTTMWALKDSTSAEEKALKSLNDEMNKYNQKVKERKNKADELMRLIKDETETEEAKLRAVNELRELYPAIFGNMDMEAIKLANEIDLKKKRNKEEEKYTEERHKQMIVDAEADKIKKELKLKELTDEQAYNPTSQKGTRILSLQKEISEISAKIIEYKKALENYYKVKEEAENNNDTQEEKKNKSYWVEKKREAENARDALDVSEKNSKDWKKYTKEIEEAQRQIDNYSDKKGGSSGESLVAKALKEAQAQADLLNKIANNDAKTALERRQLKLDNDQKLLDIDQDGWEKQQKQIELNYQKELLAIEKHAQDLLEKQQEAERLKWKESGEKGIFTPGTKLAKEQQDEIKLQQEIAEKIREHSNEALLNELVKQYQTYAEKRLEIEQKFEEDLSVLRDKNNNGELDDNIAELEKRRKQALKAIDNEESAELVKTTDLFVRLFTDAATQSVDQVRRVIDETQALYDYLSSTNSDDITAGFGFTAEQLRSFQANAEQMKSILDGLNSKKKELGSRSPVDAFTHSLKDAVSLFGKGGNDNVKLGVEKIGAATKEFLPYVKKFGDDLGAIFGQEVGGMVSGATEALDAVMNVAEGFAKGGIIGGIAAAVGEAAKLFTKAAEAEQRHIEALRAAAAEKIAMQNAYNLALLEQNLLLKEAVSIFGEKEITKAANAVMNYADAIDKFNMALKGVKPDKNYKDFDEFVEKAVQGGYQKQLEAYEKGIGALAQITTKTGHEKTGLFGWGKGKDTYTSILEQYDDLLTAEGKLNIERAKAILATQTMSDENKALLQSLIDLQDAADKAQEALKDYLKQTFGILGNDLMDSIVASIQDKGVNAWQSFGDAGAKVIENLGKQLAYELFFADKFKKLQDNLEAVYSDTIDPEEIANRQMELVSQFYNTISNDMEAAQAFMENWQKEAERRGFNLWQNDDAISQKGKPGAFATMTQDQAGKLEGLFTALQNRTASIDETVTSISDTMYMAADSLLRIADNTEYCKFLEDIANDIAIIKRDGLKAK